MATYQSESSTSKVSESDRNEEDQQIKQIRYKSDYTANQKSNKISKQNEQTKEEKPIASVNPKVRQSILFQKFCKQEQSRKKQNSRQNSMEDSSFFAEIPIQNSQNYNMFPAMQKPTAQQMKKDFNQQEVNQIEQQSIKEQNLEQSIGKFSAHNQAKQQSNSPNMSRSNSPPHKNTGNQIYQSYNMSPSEINQAGQSFIQQYPQQNFMFPSQKQGAQYQPIMFMPYNYTFNP